MDVRKGEGACDYFAGNISDMKIPRFNELPLALKADLVNDLGKLVSSIEYYDHRIELYSLGFLLVEQWENIETKRIEKIVQAGYRDLDKHLSRIVISDLAKARQR